jgi:hypothetical protein
MTGRIELSWIGEPFFWQEMRLMTCFNFREPSIACFNLEVMVRWKTEEYAGADKMRGYKGHCFYLDVAISY